MNERWFFAEVNPVPWTVPNIAVRRSKGGKPYPQLYASETLITYKKALRDEIEDRYGAIEPTGAPIGLDFFFYRQLETFETKRGRKRHSNYADATNLQKAAEDALQGVLFINDSQVQQVTSTIIEQSSDTYPAVVIKLTLNPEPNLPPASITDCLGKEPEFRDYAKENELDIDVEDFF